jgi:hypothetical protein
MNLWWCFENSMFGRRNPLCAGYWINWTEMKLSNDSGYFSTRWVNWTIFTYINYFHKLYIKAYRKNCSLNPHVCLSQRDIDFVHVIYKLLQTLTCTTNYVPASIRWWHILRYTRQNNMMTESNKMCLFSPFNFTNFFVYET